MGGGANFCEFYLQELYQVLTVTIREKSPHASGRQKGKGTIWKCTRTFYSSSQGLPSGEIILLEPNLSGVLSEPNITGKGDLQLQALVPIPVPTSRGRKLRSSGEVHSLRDRLTED